MHLLHWQINDIEVYAREIAADNTKTRRQCEQETVEIIISEVFGSGVAIDHKDDGSPVLVLSNTSDVPCISVSHSRKLAVFAVSRNPVGVDAEEWREALHKVKDRFLAKEEAIYCDTADKMLTAWTIKEAVYKASPTNNPDLRIGINIMPSMTAAKADGVVYNIKTIRHGDTVITVAYV